MSRSNPNPKLTPPPRILNVKKFAECRSRELESLHAVVSDRVNHDFKIQRSKRRRTTGYRSSKHKIRKVSASGSGLDPNPKTSRRVRRRMELQSNPVSGFVRAGDGTRRLRTHLWHAKRFTMVKRWGYCLPLGVQGRGRGSRAVLKWLRSAALVHDASYSHPLQLEGAEDSILAVLRMVLLPMPSSISEETSHLVEHGVRYNNALLYHVGTCPLQFIAPVFYMWRPIGNGNNCVTPEEHHISIGGCASVKPECTSSRQLWIWIHPAAFEEGFTAFKTACQKQMEESGVSVDCFSMEGHIARLEVIGSKATQALQKILLPTSDMSCTVDTNSSRSDRDPSTCSYLTPCTAYQVQKPFVLQNAEHLPCHTILSLTVIDPRNLPSKAVDVDPEKARPATGLQENNIPDPNTSASVSSAESQDSMLVLGSNPEVNGVLLSDSRSLWDCSEKLNPPLPESIICQDRHHKRLKHFNLDTIDDGKSASEDRDGFGQSCPILLLKHSNGENLNVGWSIVLPLSWVKVFWITLVLSGAHAIGLRERRWIACDSGLPSFPYDYPDSKAYMSLMADEAAAFDASAELRPLAVRRTKVPIPPPWECIAVTYKLELEASSNINIPAEGPHAGASFPGFITRYRDALSEHLKRTEDGLCLVRVLIRAYKEGVFEDGAIVCAPLLTDLPHWDARLEGEEESLQMSQSLVRSYFTQQDSGKWVLQIPEDCSASESCRWPIGFVTTGFVRGSKKPTAMAFCEAALLARLREEQQQQSTSTAQNESSPGICVWVRNMRSAAYRRAYATIVLEHEKEDTEFM